MKKLNQALRNINNTLREQVNRGNTNAEFLLKRLPASKEV